MMRLHVDNNPTLAQIDPPLFNGSVAADNCGVIHYTLVPPPPPPPNEPPATPSGSVTLSYTASHPNGFETHSFVLKRGVNDISSDVSFIPVGGGSYSATPAVSTLLSPGCMVAGFAESLNVYGTATDGWNRLGYDASDLRAFVLAPPS